MMVRIVWVLRLNIEPCFLSLLSRRGDPSKATGHVARPWYEPRYFGRRLRRTFEEMDEALGYIQHKEEGRTETGASCNRSITIFW